MLRINDDFVSSSLGLVTAPAEIDVTNADQLRAMLLNQAARGRDTIVVDMTRTRFCDCAGLHELVRAHQRAVADGGELRLVLPPSGLVHRIITLTGLHRLIPWFHHLDQALATDPATAIRIPQQPARVALVPLDMGDIINLTRASQLHIQRWQARLGQLRHHRSLALSDLSLADTWDTLAALIDLHMRAEEEICCPATYAIADGQDLLQDRHESRENLRELLAETSLRPPGSPLWWALTDMALAAWTRLCEDEQHGFIADCLRRTGQEFRQRVGHQWRQYREAQIRDRYPDRPGEPTCRLRLQHPLAPRLADVAFTPLACTCQACSERLAGIPEAA